MIKQTPTDTMEQARAVQEAWREIDPALPIGGLALTALETELAQAGTIYAQIDALEAQFIELRDQRDVITASLWDKVKRIRAGVKSIFGDDSPQYEMMGCTRISERKHPARKATTTA